jgi:hypothetical protein
VRVVFDQSRRVIKLYGVNSGGRGNHSMLFGLSNSTFSHPMLLHVDQYFTCAHIFELFHEARPFDDLSRVVYLYGVDQRQCSEFLLFHSVYIAVIVLI